MTQQPHGRVFDLNLHLLDRQVVDRGDDGALYVARILVGPRALGRRLRGRLGVWVRSIAERLSTEPMPSIDFALFADIDSAVRLSAGQDELQVTALEDWVDNHFILRVPGSRHESE